MASDPTAISLQQLLTVEHVADVLNLTRARTYDIIRSGILPCVKIGRQVRVHPDRLREFIEAGGAALPGGWRKEAP